MSSTLGTEVVRLGSKTLTQFGPSADGHASWNVNLELVNLFGLLVI
jgi:hypothetical protein